MISTSLYLAKADKITLQGVIKETIKDVIILDVTQTSFDVWLRDYDNSIYIKNTRTPIKITLYRNLKNELAKIAHQAYPYAQFAYIYIDIEEEGGFRIGYNYSNSTIAFLKGKRLNQIEWGEWIK